MSACRLRSNHTQTGRRDEPPSIDPDGQVRFKAPDERAPLVYVGLHIADPGIVADGPEGAFSLLPTWMSFTASMKTRRGGMTSLSILNLSTSACSSSSGREICFACSWPAIREN